MKKAKRTLSVLLMTAFALFLLLPSPFAEDRPTAVAHKVQQAIVLDGSLDEWDLSSPLVLADESQVIRDANFWNGPGDVSASIYVMWDEEYLYIGADITEDNPFGALEMLPLDGEDNIELFLSTNPADDPDRTAYATNDFKVFFVIDHEYWDTAIDRSMVEKDVRQKFVSKGLDGGENVLDGYECHAEYTTTGFIWEAKIPWACFSNKQIAAFAPQVGDTVNFDILITDIGYACPGTEYVPQIAWTGTSDISTNPALWGRLTFE